MAEFQKVVQTLKRICFGRSCGKCPLHEASGGANCNIWIKENSCEVEALIMQWAAEHPLITNRDKFKEVFGLDYLDPLPGGCSAWLTAEYKGRQNETD